MTSKWMWPAFLHGKRLKTARYSEAKEGARQQTSTALVFYGRLHFPSVVTLKKEIFIWQLLAAIWRLLTNAYLEVAMRRDVTLLLVFKVQDYS